MPASYQQRVSDELALKLSSGDRRRLRVREMAVVALTKMRDGLDPAEGKELDKACLDHAWGMLNNIRAKAHRLGEGK